MNVEGMLPFENMVADYVESTGNHVLYRVTPVFDGNNLVASGVQMEAKSVEDDGVDFAERMAEIHRELLSLQAESNDLMDTISQNMREMGL